MTKTKLTKLADKLGTGLAALGLLAAVASPARAASEHTSLAIPAYVILFLSEYVAEDMHLWDQQDLDVTVTYVAGVGAMNAVIAGSTDFSLSSGGSLTRAASHGQPLLAIANMNNRSGQIIAIRKDIADAAHFDAAAPLSQRVQVLKNRTIAIDVVQSVAHSYVRIMAKEGGFDPDLIAVTPEQPADMMSAFARHAIDGFVAGPPWPEQVVADGTGVIVANGAENDPPELNPVGSVMLITRPQFCVDHRSICVKMGHAMKLAADFIHDHPQETLAILKKRYQTVSDKVLQASYEAVRDMTPHPPAPDEAGLRNADQMNVTAGFLKPEDRVKSYTPLFTAEFAK